MKRGRINRIPAFLLAAMLAAGVLPQAAYADVIPASGREAVLWEMTESGEEIPEVPAEDPAESEPVENESAESEGSESKGAENVPEEAADAESLPDDAETADPDDADAVIVPDADAETADPEGADAETADPDDADAESAPDAESTPDDEETLEAAEPVREVRSAAIGDGLYMIVSAVSDQYVLEIAGDAAGNKGNAALGTKTGDYRQAFYIEKCGDDVYTVRNYNSGLVLDVAGGLSKNGTNVQQYTANGSEAQKWRILENEDGTVTFRSAKNGKAMDAASGRAADGTNVQIYDANGTKAQKWRLAEPCGVTAAMERLADAKLSDGFYRIVSSKNSRMCLAVTGGSRSSAANIALAKKEEGSGSVFSVKKLGGGLYELAAVHSGQVFDLQGGLTKNGTNIRQYPSNGTTAQKWYLKKDPETGFIAILSAKNARTAADLAGGMTSAGTNLRAYSFNGTAAQFFVFEKTDFAAFGEKVREGYFRILPASKPAVALGIAGGSAANSANAGLESAGGGNGQVFAFSENADGSWTVRNAGSGKVLDIAGGSRKSGANIQQYTANGTAAQKIAFVPTERGDGSYTLLVYGTLAFDAAGGKLAAGTNVRLYTPNGTAAQTWILEQAAPADGWVYDAAGNRQYARSGKLLYGWQKIDGKILYLSETEGMVKDRVVDGYYINKNGERDHRTSTILGETINGRRTLRTFLHNALVPAGRTLYIWGGGWGGLGNDASNDSAKIGFQRGWETFYDSHAVPGYYHGNYRWSYGSGLDCSGFVAWAVYNTMYTAENLEDLVVQSTSVAPTYIKRGWAYQNMAAYRPGDVVSMNGHVWISLGKCSDGSIVVLHSSPNGVQLSGTGGKAVQLADKYMKILAPGWPYATRTVEYLSKTTSKATWTVNGSGLFTDPDHIQGMSAEDVLRTLVGR